jgi:hypothetical protein
MKILNSLFKRSLSTKFDFSPLKIRNINFLHIVVLFSVLNCTSKLQPNPPQQPPEQTQNLSEGSNALTKISNRDDLIQIYSSSEADQPGFIGLLNSKVCDTPTAPQQSWSIPLDTPTGTQLLNLSFKTINNDHSTIKLNMNKRDFQLFSSLPNKDTAQDIKTICQKHKQSKPKIFGGGEKTRENIAHILQSFAPSCRFKKTSITAKGWLCQLPTSNSQTISRNLASIQKRMLRKWSRQPYLFTRKLSVTRKLAGILNNKNKQETKLKNFCNLINNSLQKELPLALGNQLWSQFVCSPNVKQSRKRVLALAHSGLNDAAHELKLLNRTVERTSRLGVLQIKIPKSSAPSRNLWVSLKPTFSHSIPPEKKPRTKRKKGKKQEADLTVSSNKKLNVGCWHPIYSSNTSLWNLAFALDLLSPEDRSRCTISPKTGDKESYPSPEQWIAESITGESEFIVTNGNSKILRLPAGLYHYKIHGLPENAAEWEPLPTDNQSQGTLEWTSRRPSKVIRKW